MQAQGSIGSWRSHVAYHNATQCVATNGKVYVLSDGSLYSYSPADEFVESYDKANSLSDQGIRHIAADEQSGTLVIIYNNANIDLVRHDGTVVNITDYANKTTLEPSRASRVDTKGASTVGTDTSISAPNSKEFTTDPSRRNIRLVCHS